MSRVALAVESNAEAAALRARRRTEQRHQRICRRGGDRLLPRHARYDSERQLRLGDHLRRSVLKRDLDARLMLVECRTPSKVRLWAEIPDHTKGGPIHAHAVAESSFWK